MFLDKKIKKMQDERELNIATIERLMEAIFIKDKKLKEDEIDTLLEYYPNIMTKINFKGSDIYSSYALKNSMKIGFIKEE